MRGARSSSPTCARRSSSPPCWPSTGTVAHVPIPGVNQEALRQLVEGNQPLGLPLLFSGGSRDLLHRALGVYPYITAQIATQILTLVDPHLGGFNEGEAGRTRLSQYTRILTVPLALLQAYAQATLLAREGIITNFGLLRPHHLPPHRLAVPGPSPAGRCSSSGWAS